MDKVYVVRVYDNILFMERDVKVVAKDSNEAESKATHGNSLNYRVIGVKEE